MFFYSFINSTFVCNNLKLKIFRLASYLKMRGLWPCTKPLRLSLLFLIALVSQVNAISYRCENNQVLIVQSFGNDTIRMHCQRLHLCGYEKMVSFKRKYLSVCNQN